MGLPQIAQELAGQMPVQLRAVADKANLEVEEEASVIEVRRADDGNVLVHHQGLGVQHAGFVLVDTHAAADQLIKIGACSARH